MEGMKSGSPRSGFSLGINIKMTEDSVREGLAADTPRMIETGVNPLRNITDNSSLVSTVFSEESMEIKAHELKAVYLSVKAEMDVHASTEDGIPEQVAVKGKMDGKDHEFQFEDHGNGTVSMNRSPIKNVPNIKALHSKLDRAFAWQPKTEINAREKENYPTLNDGLLMRTQSIGLLSRPQSDGQLTRTNSRSAIQNRESEQSLFEKMRFSFLRESVLSEDEDSALDPNVTMVYLLPEPYSPMESPSSSPSSSPLKTRGTRSLGDTSYY